MLGAHSYDEEDVPQGTESGFLTPTYHFGLTEEEGLWRVCTLRSCACTVRLGNGRYLQHGRLAGWQEAGCFLYFSTRLCALLSRQGLVCLKTASSSLKSDMCMYLAAPHSDGDLSACT